MIENGNVAKKVGERIKQASNYNMAYKQLPISTLKIEIAKGLMKHLKKVGLSKLKDDIDKNFPFKYTLDALDNTLIVDFPIEGRVINDEEIEELLRTEIDIIKCRFGDYSNDEEKDTVESLQSEWQNLLDGLFAFRRRVEEEFGYAESDRAREMLGDLYGEVNRFLEHDEDDDGFEVDFDTPNIPKYMKKRINF